MVVPSLIPVLAAAILHGGVRASDNGLALTPPMGWNTWNYFACSISEDTILSAAKRMVETGLKDVGYEYVLIDDCWQAPTRNATTGAPMADPEKFPRGIKALADEIHALGLKLGIYSDAGVMTCGRRHGSLGYEEIDAQTYASWEVDYLKYDNCFNQGESGTPQISFKRYNAMSKALNATGRPILYSMCNWGDDQPWNWATTIANSWRISGDIIDEFTGYDDRCPCDDMLDCKLPGFHCSAARIIDYAAPLGQKAWAGGWNDLDMLEVGNGGMGYDEYVAHFSMWAILKSPLLLGNNLNEMDEETLSIITNRAIISISQDSYPSPAIRRWRRPLRGHEATYSTVAGTPSLQLWSGGLSGGGTVVALLNTGEEEQRVGVEMGDVFRDESVEAKRMRYRVYDLWQKVPHPASSSDEQTPMGAGNVWGKDVGAFDTMLPNVKVGAHSVRVFKLVPDDSDDEVKVGHVCDEL